jgi:hypothetical protein
VERKTHQVNEGGSKTLDPKTEKATKKKTPKSEEVEHAAAD